MAAALASPSGEASVSVNSAKTWSPPTVTNACNDKPHEWVR